MHAPWLLCTFVAGYPIVAASGGDLWVVVPAILALIAAMAVDLLGELDGR
jgi:hypothetical protein